MTVLLKQAEFDYLYLNSQRYKKVRQNVAMMVQVDSKMKTSQVFSLKLVRPVTPSLPNLSVADHLDESVDFMLTEEAIA